MKVSELHTELEEYRCHALFMIKENSQAVKKIAEDVLNAKVLAIKPIGSVTNPSKFTEESDIDIGVYIESGKNLDADLSEKLQEVMVQHPINDLGVLNTLVFK